MDKGESNMNDYGLGAWECLNYVIRYLQKVDKEIAIEELKTIKEQLEMGVAIDFQRKMLKT